MTINNKLFIIFGLTTLALTVAVIVAVQYQTKLETTATCEFDRIGTMIGNCHQHLGHNVCKLCIVTYHLNINGTVYDIFYGNYELLITQECTLTLNTPEPCYYNENDIGGTLSFSDITKKSFDLIIGLSIGLAFSCILFLITIFQQIRSFIEQPYIMNETAYLMETHNTNKDSVYVNVK